jgi:hypothetical protein
MIALDQVDFVRRLLTYHHIANTYKRECPVNILLIGEFSAVLQIAHEDHILIQKYTFTPISNGYEQ